MSLGNWLDAAPQAINTRFRVILVCFLCWIVGMVTAAVASGEIFR